MAEQENDAPKTPYDRLGGEAVVAALVERFYDAMEQDFPALAALHEREDGKVSRGARDRFALFLNGWLGGPQDYLAKHGHPRLRMRHGHLPIDGALRDAWLACMKKAMAGMTLEPSLKAFLDGRFAEVADFLRNRPG